MQMIAYPDVEMISFSIQSSDPSAFETESFLGHAARLPSFLTPTRGSLLRAGAFARYSSWSRTGFAFDRRFGYITSDRDLFSGESRRTT